MNMDDTFTNAEAGPSGTQYAAYPEQEVTDDTSMLQAGAEEQGNHEELEAPGEAELDAEATEAAVAAAEAEAAMHAHHMQFHRPFKPPDLSNTPKRTQRRAKLGSQQTQAPPSFQSKYQLAGHKKLVTSIRFSPDGQWLATAGADGRVLLFAISKTSQPSFVKSFTVPPPDPPRFVRTTQANYANGNGPIANNGINDITFSPDSQSLAIAADDKIARIWKADAPQQPPDVSFDHESHHEVNGLNGHANIGIDEYARRPNGRTPSSDDGVKILKGHTSFVFCVAFSPQGNLLATGSYDETIRIWDVKRARCLRTLPAHSDPVSAVNFSRDGTLLCSSGHDGLLRLWDASTGQCLKTLVGEANPPASFATFSPNSRYILCSSLDSSIRLWDYHAAQCVKTYAGHKNIKYHISAFFLVEDDGAGAVYVVSGSEDGKIYFWDLQTRKALLEQEAHKEAVLCLAYDHHSGMLASTSMDSDHTVTLWSASPTVEGESLPANCQAPGGTHTGHRASVDGLQQDTVMNGD